MNQAHNQVLPAFFEAILWSYDFSKINAVKYKKTIIINTINYGDLGHWKWIKENYGLADIQKVLDDVVVTELRPPALKLASILFSVKKINYARRGAK